MTLWTQEQVDSLNEQQKRWDRHPYTCPGDHDECKNQRNLIATTSGWICACGKYTQNWAHEFSLYPSNFDNTKLD